ncbi:hypothetical protein EKH55_5054 [Sinorhizobium alkalisoli]|nr:hypothetical protein EKH55_5054 [Sinorhizobium alkalisoli]
MGQAFPIERAVVEEEQNRIGYRPVACFTGGIVRYGSI